MHHLFLMGKKSITIYIIYYFLYFLPKKNVYVYVKYVNIFYYCKVL